MARRETVRYGHSCGAERAPLDVFREDRPLRDDGHIHREGPAPIAGGPTVADSAGSCRLCPVACERLVYPSGCLESGCTRLYSYDRAGRPVMGCLEGVFSVEIDIDAFTALQRTRAGFGALRVRREPLAICRCVIERTFEHRPHGDCANPGFLAAAPPARA